MDMALPAGLVLLSITLAMLLHRGRRITSSLCIISFPRDANQKLGIDIPETKLFVSPMPPIPKLGCSLGFSISVNRTIIHPADHVRKSRNHP